MSRLAPHHVQQLDMRSPDLGFLDATWYPAEIAHGIIDAMLAQMSKEDAVAFAKKASCAGHALDAHRRLSGAL